MHCLYELVRFRSPMKELTKAQTEKLAENWPEYPMGVGEMESLAIGYLKENAKVISYDLMDGKFGPTRKWWKLRIKQHKESQRYRAWLSAAGAQWDEHRGCYMAMNESPECSYLSSLANTRHEPQPPNPNNLPT